VIRIVAALSVGVDPILRDFAAEDESETRSDDDTAREKDPKEANLDLQNGTAQF
jgi:hypothetical protein